VKFTNFFKILALASHHRFLLFKSLVALIVVSFCLLSIGNEMKELIDKGLNPQNLDLLNTQAVKIISLICIFCIASFFRATSINQLSNKIIHELRTQAYENLLKLKVEYYEETSSAKIQLNIIDDAQSIAVMMQEIFSFLLRNTIIFISSLLLMCLQSTLLFSVTIAVVLVVLLPLIWSIRYNKSSTQKYKDSLSKMAELTAETVDNIKLVYSYNLQDYSSRLFNSISQNLQTSSNRLNFRRSLFFSCIVCFICISVTLIIWAGSYQILSDNITSGQLVAFMIYAVMTVASLIGILNNYSELQPQLSRFNRLLEVIQNDNHEEQHFQIYTFPNNLDIKFEGVSFAYPTRKDIKLLNNFCANIKSGEFTAIYGKSGIGKSTLLYLLLKFYKPQSGSILVSDNCISKISTPLIRQNFVFVNQDPLIFSTSILENITLGKPYTKNDLDRVIEACGLVDLLSALPEGLETSVGQKGFKISGGQKQRICIARSLLSKPQVLLLDEATKALDTASEDQILANIKTIMQNKTIICVSHNNKIIQSANNSIHLDSSA